MQLELPSRRATSHLAQAFARALRAGDVVVLEGELGAGKTFFVRACLRALGVPEKVAVTSPTFTLVQDFRLPSLQVLHADLYRLQSADELEELGIVPCATERPLVLVEWGERFKTELGADLVLTLHRRGLQKGRSAELLAYTPRGQELVELVSSGRSG